MVAGLGFGHPPRRARLLTSQFSVGQRPFPPYSVGENWLRILYRYLITNYQTTCNMVAQLGFEPRQTAPEAAVLPLHHRAPNLRSRFDPETPLNNATRWEHCRRFGTFSYKNFERRARTFSRPNNSIMSKSPAPTVLPLIATRVGCISSAAFILSSSASFL